MEATEDLRILLAVDGSEHSERAVRYVAKLVGRQPDCRVHLLHVVEPMPPAALETRGSNDPAEEDRQGAALEAAERRWIEEHASGSTQMLEALRAILLEAGLGAEQVSTGARAPMPEDKVADVLLAEARAQGHGTIVVGRRALPWYREMFARHVGDALLEHLEGRALWVIG
jgi:nucleotide-binding universal stress UspA family protein